MVQITDVLLMQDFCAHKCLSVQDVRLHKTLKVASDSNFLFANVDEITQSRFEVGCGGVSLISSTPAYIYTRETKGSDYISILHRNQEDRRGRRG